MDDDSQLSLFGARPTRKRGSPGPDHVESSGRDDALDLLSEKRADLVEIGRNIAITLARRRNRITSVEVFAEMRAQGYDDYLDATDPRWMGVVFREPIWERVGFEATGSHRRPVTIWGLVDPQNIPPSPRERVYRAICAARSAGRTVSELVLDTGLSRTQVKKLATELEKLDRVSGLVDKRNGGHTYVAPQWNPEIG